MEAATSTPKRPRFPTEEDLAGSPQPGLYPPPPPPPPAVTSLAAGTPSWAHSPGTPPVAWPQHSSSPQLALLNLTPEPDTPPVAARPNHLQPQQQQQQSQLQQLQQQQQDASKRGRPRADLITHLILEGSSSPSEIKCKVCNRVFPREKSLQAHLRTHTGEKPYVCDYPNCSRAFTQSGQLKTHQRLHAGEKPFACSAPGCPNRYTHANRTCPVHPFCKPQRSPDVVLAPTLSSNSDDNEAVLKWLENYRKERQEKTPGKVNLVSSSPLLNKVQQSSAKKVKTTKRGLAIELEQENHQPPVTSQNQQQQQQHYALPQQQQQHNILQAPPCLPLLQPPPQQLQLLTPVKASPSPLIERLSSPLAASENSCLSSPPRHDVSLSSPLARPVSLSSPMARPASSPLKPLHRSPVRRRMALGEISLSGDNNKLVPKKRWIQEVFQQQEKRRQTPGTPPKPSSTTPPSTANEVEDLSCRPIQWTEEELEKASNLSRSRSPKSWIVATALVELGSENNHPNIGHHPAEARASGAPDEENQPLNLSLSSSLS